MSHHRDWQNEEWFTETETTWGNVLTETVNENKSDEAIIFEGNRLTYDDLEAEVDALAKGLLEIGVEKGDKIGIWMMNCPEWIITELAGYKIGAWVAPVNTRFGRSELQHLLSEGELSVLFIQDSFAGKDKTDLLTSVISPGDEDADSQEFDGFPNLEYIVNQGDQDLDYALSFEEVQERGAERSYKSLVQAQSKVRPYDISRLGFTSGTTGQPKGVQLMHRTEIATCWDIFTSLGATSDDRLLLNVPLWTTYGSMLCSTGSILNGNTIVLQEQFNPEESLKAIERNEVNNFQGSISMATMQFKHEKVDQYDLTSLERGIVGGEGALPAEREYVSEYIPDLRSVYGFTEGSGLSSMTTPDDPEEKFLTTDGKVLPHSEIVIKEIGTNNTLPAGEVGEICVGDVYPGTSVMKDYLDEELTTEVIDEEGFIHSGDLGSFDDQGYLTVKGRKDDMFNVGGLNAYPPEVENHIQKIDGVQMVGVVGAPDPEETSDACIAYVQLSPGADLTEEDVIEFLEGEIADYKVPKYVEFINDIDDWPLTPNGKIMRRELRERAEENVV